MWSILRQQALQTGAEIQKFTGPEHPVYSVAVSQDGSQIAAAGMGVGDPRSVFVWNKETAEPAHILTGHPDDIYRVQFSRDGQQILSLGYAGHLRIWNPSAGKAVFEHTLGKVSYSARFSPDGKTVVVSSNDRTARILEVPADAQ